LVNEGDRPDWETGGLGNGMFGEQSDERDFNCVWAKICCQTGYRTQVNITCCDI
jgi:hypothetical protein